jgi:hypothetical protein
MKASRVAVLLLVFVVAASFAGETNTLPSTIIIDGITYSNVTWRTVTPATVTIFHQTGVASIPLEKLPPELQKKFGYDPVKAAEQQKREAAANRALADAEDGRIARAVAEERANPADGAIIKECYVEVDPMLERSDGKLTPEVRRAYLDWAEKTVLQELLQGKQTVPQDCLAEVRADATLRDAMFGAVFPPDPSILQNYAHLRADLGTGFVRPYRSLAIAVAVAKRIKGVEIRSDLTGAGEASPLPSGVSRNFGRDYQPEFWVDESLQPVRSEAEKKMIGGIADFIKTSQIAAVELYQNPARQRQLVAFLSQRNVAPALIAQTKQSVQFGEWLKNAMVLLGQRPAAREGKPDTANWVRHLASIYQATPSSTPTLEGAVMSWPLFPIHKAPWPLLMPLARPVPLAKRTISGRRSRANTVPIATTRMALSVMTLTLCRMSCNHPRGLGMPGPIGSCMKAGASPSPKGRWIYIPPWASPPYGPASQGTQISSPSSLLTRLGRRRSSRPLPEART